MCVKMYTYVAVLYIMYMCTVHFIMHFLKCMNPHTSRKYTVSRYVRMYSILLMVMDQQSIHVDALPDCVDQI